MSTDIIQLEQLQSPSLEAAAIDFVVTTEYDNLLFAEQIAMRSAEALMQLEVQYGPEMAEFVGNWCVENNQNAEDVIDNIAVPLSYLALGATVRRDGVALDGYQIFGRTD